MIHYTLPPRRPAHGDRNGLIRTMPSADVAPITADRYLKLRREAAGLTVQQAARRMFPGDDTRAGHAADMIRSLETPGVRARLDFTLDRLSLAFSFDADVYRQLAHDPAARHPRVCGGCGCSQNDACVSADGHDCCAWSPSSRDGAALCTRCTGEDR